MTASTPLLVTFAAYLLLMVGIGFWAWRSTCSFDDYILGGRSLGSYVTALSAGASDMSGWLLLGLPGALYLGGAVVLGLGHLYCALRLVRPPGERFAPWAFGYSTLYLYALFALLLVDHWLGRPAIGAADYVYRLIG